MDAAAVVQMRGGTPDMIGDVISLTLMNCMGLICDPVAGLVQVPCAQRNAYQEQVVKNAKALSAALIDEGFDILTGGTDNHLMLVDLRNMDISGKELQNRCDEAYITLNKNTVPNDPRSPFVTSGVRIGTPAVTTRGMVESDMKEIAHFIHMVATDYDAKADEVREQVRAKYKKSSCVNY